MAVEYAKQTLKTPNPIARYAHQKRHELSVGKIVKIMKENSTLLDYGCGKGDFLNEVASIRNDANLLGFDPYSNHSSSKYKIINDTDSVDDDSVDVFCCFEVLEHLYDHERTTMYAEAKRVLKDNGDVVISVPVIGGPTLLLKEINRMILFKRKSDYSFVELILASFFGISAKRPENPRPTHKGFDFKEVQKELSNNFSIEEKRYSPFPKLPWFLNSQVFYSCVRKK